MPDNLMNKSILECPECNVPLDILDNDISSIDPDNVFCVICSTLSDEDLVSLWLNEQQTNAQVVVVT